MPQGKTLCQGTANRNATRHSFCRWEQEINLTFNLSPPCEVETDLGGNKSPLSFYESCGRDESKAGKFNSKNLEDLLLKQEAF